MPRRRWRKFSNFQDSDEDPDQRMQDRLRALQAGQRTLRRIRWRVGVSMFALGAVLGFGFVALGHTFGDRVRERNVCEVNTAQDHVLLISFEACFYGRLFSFSLAPLADDLRFLRAVLCLDALVILAGIAQSLMFLQWRLTHHASKVSRMDRLPHAVQASLVGLVCVFSIFFCTIVFATCAKEAKTMQARMWRSIALFTCLMLACSLTWNTAKSAVCHTFVATWWQVLFETAASVFALKTSYRKSVQALLCRLAERHAAARAAAGIAALVGDLSVKEAHAQAARRFRSIRLVDLSYEDLATNAPNPELFLRSSPTTLNECDAFISHSWHDDARAKWGALQRWRRSFVERVGREPTMWFDKCCIDQSNIDADLRCLPIFLSGCKSLVVFAGPTYLSRLWCIMELFTFAHMHRGADAIEVILVSDRQTREDLDRIRQTFADFDAGLCQCHLPEDKARLLQIIETAFGNLGAFNEAAKKIFRDIGFLGDVRKNESLSESCSSEDSVNWEYSDSSDDQDSSE